MEEVEDDVAAVDVGAGDVADEPVPELGERPVLPVVDVQVGEDHGVHGAPLLQGPLQVRGVPAVGKDSDVTSKVKCGGICSAAIFCVMFS